MLEELGEDGLGELVQLVQDDAGAVGAPGDEVPVLGVAEDVVQLGEEGRHHASRVLARRVRGIRTGSRLAAGGEGCTSFWKRWCPRGLTPGRWRVPTRTSRAGEQIG